jgi:hypothetical protein
MNYKRSVELKKDLPDKGASAYFFLAEALEGAKNFQEASGAFKTAAIISWSLKNKEYTFMCLSEGFQLIEHIQNENVEYCGLFLYIMTGNDKIKDTLQKIKIQEKNLRKIFDLALKKAEGKNIRNEIQGFKRLMKSPDLGILLSVLETFQ